MVKHDKGLEKKHTEQYDYLYFHFLGFAKPFLTRV